MRDHGYFNDIGTPASYLRANHDVLDGSARTTIGGGAGLVAVAEDAAVDPSARLVAPCLVAAGATVGPERLHRPHAVVGAGARVAQGARVARGVVHEHADVGVDARVEDAVVGTRARVAAGAAIADRIVAPDEPSSRARATPREGDMLDQAGAFGEQLRAPVPGDLLRGRGPFTDVVLAGLGGSAAGARLAVALLESGLRMPVAVAGAASCRAGWGPRRSSS